MFIQCSCTFIRFPGALSLWGYARVASGGGTGLRSFCFVAAVSRGSSHHGGTQDRFWFDECGILMQLVAHFGIFQWKTWFADIYCIKPLAIDQHGKKSHTFENTLYKAQLGDFTLISEHLWCLAGSSYPLFLTFVQSALTSNVMKNVIILAFAVLFAGVLADPKEPALQQDDECASSGEACGLHALQLRSEEDREEPDSNFTNLDHIDPDDEQLLCILICLNLSALFSWIGRSLLFFGCCLCVWWVRRSNLLHPMDLLLR